MLCKEKRMKKNGASLLVECLESLGVDRIFGIPGAKIDSVFNALLDSNIQLIVCRHEQNAAFMAAAYGRLTGRPGVVLVTSGPGVSNLATGLLTATTEGDPVIALAGNVPREMQLKESHQNTDNVRMLAAATKSSVEVQMVNNIPEVIANAYRVALMPRSGAAFISLPQDILLRETTVKPVEYLHAIAYSGASENRINHAADLINNAKLPVLFLGEEASRPANTKAIRALLKKNPMPTISTYQAAGVVSKALVDNFIGRVGLFKNQAGDKLLDLADLVICVGFNPVEYDPETWNADYPKKIIHLDYSPAKIHLDYQPVCELLGAIDETVIALSDRLTTPAQSGDLVEVKKLHDDLMTTIQEGAAKDSKPIHPLRFIWDLRETIDDETLVICDIGTVYMWMARYFLSYRPHHLLFSNGQQTLGVALPWALSAALQYPDKQIVSISGDGGFLFSAMELETAVREKVDFIHFVWRDGAYNMVLEQELLKYQRKSGVDFGDINLVDFAKAFGATGFELTDPNDFPTLFAEAKKIKGPVLVDVPIDYSDNPALFVTVDEKIVR